MRTRPIEQPRSVPERFVERETHDVNLVGSQLGSRKALVSHARAPWNLSRSLQAAVVPRAQVACLRSRASTECAFVALRRRDGNDGVGKGWRAGWLARDSGTFELALCKYVSQDPESRMLSTDEPLMCEELGHEMRWLGPM